MSEPQTAAPATAAPEATPASPAPAAAAPPEATPAPKPPASDDPNWLTPRLEQARRAAETELLKTYGAKDKAELDAKLQRLAQLEEATLSEQEKAAKHLAELQPKAARAEALEQTVRQYAERELSGLSDLQRAAVTALAGDDPANVLRAIESLKPTWGAQSQPAPESPPANTSTAARQPAPGGSESPPDHKAIFAHLRKTNPFEAARYRLAHAKHLV